LPESVAVEDVLAVRLVGGDPPRRQPTIQSPAQHRQALRGFGREHHLFVNAASARRAVSAHHP
jgi:hypothetical protein